MSGSNRERRGRSILVGLVLAACVLACPCEGTAQVRAPVPDRKVSSVGDPRGRPELTVCTQNMKNYGLYPESAARTRGLTPEKFADQERALLTRMQRAGCDVIGVQEIISDSAEKGQRVLEGFAKKLQNMTGRRFRAEAAESGDKYMRTGFLVARDRADVLNMTNYASAELPKFVAKEKPRFFTRGPAEMQIRVKGLDGAPDKTVTIVNFHFKARGSLSGSRDRTGLEFETLRMQMAEALRRIVENRHAQSFASGETILVVLGDRNDHSDTASARILEGTLALKSFQSGGTCRLSKRGVPLCQANSVISQRLFSVVTGDPQTGQLQGSHKYGKVYSWLDDILLPAESLPFARADMDTIGDYDSGVVYTPKEASDHALVYVRLNW